MSDDVPALPGARPIAPAPVFAHPGKPRRSGALPMINPRKR
ncbi:hypothetical protein [Bordetella holmesii]|uniref:Uncharacterized protein n=2 Tax=Bordetella holmesii TaxID=35814 RepID=A0A158M5V1_9BORD|nr:hypothetical protein [Bordetella holmesii]AHV94289.1 hypothetical protein D560_0438 [Bordetella holmesii ATCC 51541]AIT25127.1 hypothetical protein D558_0436 [Bordetella holmesii 44057]EWM45690.1 hypothetical protein D557_3696 [Bordetella holmesii 70147]EWM48652.1 hypothetical protein D556_0437 [Bordetella holmesii 41130]EWM49814.1 hypothetical protein D555_0440 [Bordetella holmesii 35009]KAK83956.1 hypothetical protein L503_2127 [Bordetella holmesii CDC-H809-BH]KAK84781.1 hypothetical pr